MHPVQLFLLLALGALLWVALIQGAILIIHWFWL
jgi:hypothetical protein